MHVCVCVCVGVHPLSAAERRKGTRDEAEKGFYSCAINQNYIGRTVQTYKSGIPRVGERFNRDESLFPVTGDKRSDSFTNVTGCRTYRAISKSTFVPF